jgi:hypothetical protein
MCTPALLGLTLLMQVRDISAEYSPGRVTERRRARMGGVSMMAKGGGGQKAKCKLVDIEDEYSVRLSFQDNFDPVHTLFTAQSRHIPPLDGNCLPINSKPQTSNF